MTDEVRAMGTGHWPQSDDPVWVLVHEPTAAQVADAVKVAGHKIHMGVGVAVRDYKRTHVSGDGWHWWLLLNKRVSWFRRDTAAYHADEFNPDEGRRISPGKHHYTRPGRWERPFMKAQGERALHKFIDGMDATNAERAVYLHAIVPVITAVQYGDLPAAIHSAQGAGLNTDLKGDLIAFLEDELIWWPDFQRDKSTSKDRTIPHHVPGDNTNSGTTSVTVSQTIGSVSVTAG